MERIGIEKYDGVMDSAVLSEVQRTARAIYGMHVLHVNSTFHGGGVASMLNSLVPLMNDVGINADWNLLYGDPAVFAVTKKIHNGLQGESVRLTDQELDAYLALNRTCALYSPMAHDVVIVHDPQPLPMIRFVRRANPWVWRCHIDVSAPNEDVELAVRPLIARYDAAVVSSERFRRPSWHLDTYVIPPAIDPFSDLNREMSEAEIDGKLDQYGIVGAEPFLLQVSRFDKWKDPMGVIRVFDTVRQEAPCRLVLLGSMATDDPEGPALFREVQKAVEKRPDITLITASDPLLVNAAQRRAAVVVQLSLREGFGLTVSEALWKGTPVVATSVGGIPLQIIDGKTGSLVSPGDVQGATERITQLLQHPSRREEFGGAGREHVREHFLIPRLLLDWLRLLNRLA
ncbi:MAG: glycosyltransferase [Candidatus Bipolaricaulota bacterium]